MSDSYILEIKNKRKDFINSFEKNIENIDNELIRASNDNQLNSIRIHKYLTETGVLGKVKTARFLDDIGLNEKSKFVCKFNKWSALGGSLIRTVSSESNSGINDWKSLSGYSFCANVYSLCSSIRRFFNFLFWYTKPFIVLTGGMFIKGISSFSSYPFTRENWW